MTNASYSANTIQLTKLIDPSTAYVNEATLSLQVANAMCNYNAWLSVSSQNGGLAPTKPVLANSPGFLTQVPYTVQAVWGSLNATLDTSSSKLAKIRTHGANLGSLSLKFHTNAIQTPLVQGSYTDVVTVKIGASL
jgi:hypothetical protein